MAVASRTRSATARANGAIPMLLQVAVRVSNGQICEPSDPVALSVTASTPTSVLEQALCNSRVRGALRDIEPIRSGSFRVLYAYLRRQKSSRPMSGKKLGPTSSLVNLKEYRDYVMCVLIETTTDKDQTLFGVSQKDIPTQGGVGKRRKRKLSSRQGSDEIPMCKRPRRAVSPVSSITDTQKSNVGHQSQFKSNSEIVALERGSSVSYTEDSFEYFVPTLPDRVSLPLSQDAVICGMLNALSEEGNLLFPRSLDEEVMSLFVDISAVLVHLQNHCASKILQTLIPPYLMKILKENDTRPEHHRLIEILDVTREEAEKVNKARNNLKSHLLVAQGQHPPRKVLTASSAKSEEELGGKLWLESKLRGSICDLLDRFHLWSPNLATHKCKAADEDRVRARQPMSTGVCDLRNSKEETWISLVPDEIGRSSKRRRSAPLRLSY